MNDSVGTVKCNKILFYEKILFYLQTRVFFLHSLQNFYKGERI